jgi:hypothetical protein
MKTSAAKKSKGFWHLLVIPLQLMESADSPGRYAYRSCDSRDSYISVAPSRKWKEKKTHKADGCGKETWQTLSQLLRWFLVERAEQAANDGITTIEKSAVNGKEKDSKADQRSRTWYRMGRSCCAGSGRTNKQ